MVRSDLYPPGQAWSSQQRSRKTVTSEELTRLGALAQRCTCWLVTNSWPTKNPCCVFSDTKYCSTRSLSSFTSEVSLLNEKKDFTSIPWNSTSLEPCPSCLPRLRPCVPMHSKERSSRENLTSCQPNTLTWLLSACMDSAKTVSIHLLPDSGDQQGQRCPWSCWSGGCC